MNTEKQKQEMSFLEHLEVFRWHLVRSVFAVLFFAVPLTKVILWGALVWGVWSMLKKD